MPKVGYNDERSFRRLFKAHTGLALPQERESEMVPMEGVEPTQPYGYQILSLARLPIPPHRLPDNQLLTFTNHQ